MYNSIQFQVYPLSKIILFKTIFFLSLLLTISSCSKEEENEISDFPENFKTKNIIVLVIDGPRFQETWGSNDELIPKQKELRKNGVFFDSFYNDGSTYTMPGHANICTGTYENIANNGEENPLEPSIFQRFLAHHLFAPRKCQIITSKLKLKALANCKDLEWRNSFNPFTNSSNREDSVTLRISKESLIRDQPILMLIQFKGPDVAGHQNNWISYLNQIKQTDSYAAELWTFLQNDPNYKNKTALLITNDHGRHLNNIHDGFVSHGDKCEGCSHISLLALGPDFAKDRLVSKKYEQIDLAPTISKILKFPWEGQGKPINELITQP